MIGENKLKKKLYFLIKNPFSIKMEDREMLLTLIEKFPYFQIPKILYLKNIKKHKIEYTKNLKNTAISTANRSLLLNYIKHKNEVKALSILEKKLTLYEWMKSSELFTAENLENFDFKDKKSLKFRQINNFITKFPSNSVIKENSKLNENLERENIKNLKKNENLKIEDFFEAENFQKIITETLAKAYLDQKKYKIALKAYEILMDKYPKKKAFFAETIKIIKENIYLN